MDVIYKLTYKPHLNTDYPKYYIGSKKNWKDSYRGSVASKAKFTFTKEMTLAEWWKLTKPEDFDVEFLETYDDVSCEFLIEKELYYQKYFDVESDDYFNGAYASKGFFHRPNDDRTKQKKSEAMKNYWLSERSEEKRARLIQRNKEVKSKQMKERWSNPTDAMINRTVHGRPKGSKDIKTRRQRKEQRVCVDGVVYKNAKEAGYYFKLTPNSIRRRCRLDEYPDWRYV